MYTYITHAPDQLPILDDLVLYVSDWLVLITGRHCYRVSIVLLLRHITRRIVISG